MRPHVRSTTLLAGALIALAAVGGMPSPAIAQDGTADRIVAISRRDLPVARRIVPFDGRVEEEVGTEVTVTLDADVLFAFDQASLTPQAQETLTALGAELADRLAGDAVGVVGHTDSKGETAYNQDLSERRAAAVRDFLAPLVSGLVRFDVAGRGESEPVAPNEAADGSDDPEGRRRNRRVEVSFEAKPEQEPTG